MKLRLKNIIVGSLVGLVVAVGAIAIRSETTQADVGQMQEINPLTVLGGRVQDFQLLPANKPEFYSTNNNNDVAAIGLTSANSPTVFKMMGQPILNGLTAYGNSFFGRLYSGYGSIPAESGVGSISTQTAEPVTLSASGGIRLQSKIANGNPGFLAVSGERYACVNDFGVLQVCNEVLTATCGSAHEGTTASAPSSNLCSTGTASSVSSASGGFGGSSGYDYTWTCTEGSTTASCGSYQSSGGGGEVGGGSSVNGQCGSADGGTYSTPPSSNLCSAGNATSVQTNPGNRENPETTYTWNCNGINGGSNDSCLATEGSSGGGKGGSVKG